MKYQPVTTVYLLLLLTITLFTGLFITQQYINQELPYTIEPPSISGGLSIAYLVAGIIIATIIIYVITRFKFEKLLKAWFSIAIIISIAISLSVLIDELTALFVASILGVIRLSSKDLVIHNLTEVLLYGGLVSLFTPLFTPLTTLILLVIISVYDYVSVFVTKHMIVLAQSQSRNNLFTGLLINRGSETALLGGGDIAFSLLFATVLGSAYGIIHSYITIYLVIASIAALTLFGRKGKFYPAMPFITVACSLSYLTVLII